MNFFLKFLYQVLRNLVWGLDLVVTHLLPTPQRVHHPIRRQRQVERTWESWKAGSGEGELRMALDSKYAGKGKCAFVSHPLQVMVSLLKS